MITYLASQWHVIPTSKHPKENNDFTHSLDKNKETNSLWYKRAACVSPIIENSIRFQLLMTRFADKKGA